jgi:hypothetical protein
VLTNDLSRTDTQDLDTRRPVQKLSQAVHKGRFLTRPTPARQDTPLPQARPQQIEKAEVEVKVKRQTGSCLLNLSLSLNLPITLADFLNSLLSISNGDPIEAS